jgi:hypothetical protein
MCWWWRRLQSPLKTRGGDSSGGGEDQSRWQRRVGTLLNSQTNLVNFEKPDEHFIH